MLLNELDACEAGAVNGYVRRHHMKTGWLCLVVKSMGRIKLSDFHPLLDVPPQVKWNIL
jgi:hypothetical protein